MSKESIQTFNRNNSEGKKLINLNLSSDSPSESSDMSDTCDSCDACNTHNTHNTSDPLTPSGSLSNSLEELDNTPKKLKQFVIVKEYNGSYKSNKKTRREYMEKTILKEQVPKKERNSLAKLLDKEKEGLKKIVDLNSPRSTEQKIKKQQNHQTLNNNRTLNNKRTLNNDNGILETMKTGAMYTVLAAGGLLGAYAIMKARPSE